MWRFYFSFSCRNLLHGNCLLTGVSFSIKILLAKITSLFWISLCNLLSMSSFRIGSISWCCFVVLLFCRCFPVLLFHYIPIITPLFRCSASVPVFCRCSMFRRSAFRCSWFYSMPLIKLYILNYSLSRSFSFTAI